MLVSRVQYMASGPWYWTVRSAQVAKFHNQYSKEIRSLMKYFSIKEMLRWKSTNSGQQSSITETKDSENTQLTFGEKVKQNTKDASYLGVIVAGVGVTGIMFYAILRELFSGHSPNSVYTEAFKLCKKDERIIDAVGLPIKGYGEETARGRRRHVSHMEYIKDDVNYMRMKFYIQGSRRKGTVHLEVKENDRKKYEYRYLFVEMDGYPPKTIVLEDNRDVTQQNVLTGL